MKTGLDELPPEVLAVLVSVLPLLDSPPDRRNVARGASRLGRFWDAGPVGRSTLRPSARASPQGAPARSQGLTMRLRDTVSLPIEICPHLVRVQTFVGLSSKGERQHFDRWVYGWMADDGRLTATGRTITEAAENLGALQRLKAAARAATS